MIRKYAALMRAAWAQMVEYRAEIVLWMMSSLWVVIMLLVWLSVAEDGPINGYSAADYVTHFMLTLFVRNMTAVWASWELDYHIRQGSMSPKLLRPFHPVHSETTANLAEKGLRLAVLLPIIATVFVLLPHAPLALSPINVLLFLVSLALGWVITFFFDFSIGILGFWTSQSTAFVQVFYVFRMLFSGVLAPLAMFPGWLQGALQWLPFRYMISFSVEIGTGRVVGDVWLGLLIQAAWALLITAFTFAFWRVALRSYSAVGA